MNPMDEFFDAHRNGKGKKPRKAATKVKDRAPLDLDTPLFHSSPTISFSIIDVFKAGILWGEIGARERSAAQQNANPLSGE